MLQAAEEIVLAKVYMGLELLHLQFDANIIVRKEVSMQTFVPLPYRYAVRKKSLQVMWIHGSVFLCPLTSRTKNFPV